LYKKLDVTEACDATFWCLFLHAFFLMSRKSNIVPNSVKTFNPNKQLCRSKIEIVASQASVTSSFLYNYNNMSGVIGEACFGQCGFNLDNTFNIKFN
jgi:hypothetical protein